MWLILALIKTKHVVDSFDDLIHCRSLEKFQNKFRDTTTNEYKSQNEDKQNKNHNTEKVKQHGPHLKQKLGELMCS